MISAKLLKRINELTKISRERELTLEEIEERRSLRDQYREGIKGRLKDVLDKVEISE